MPPKNDKRKGNNDDASKAKVPGVLRCAYSDISSLEEVVMRLCADAGMSPPTLRHKGDDRTYSDALLRRTLCAIHARAPKLPSHAASFDVASSLEETHARPHAAKWGCYWNRDIVGIVKEAGLTIVQRHEFHFGTTQLIVAEST